jgi:hypothetical protein
VGVTARVIVRALIASVHGHGLGGAAAGRRAGPEKMSFSWRLVGYLLKCPAWFVGIASMILSLSRSPLVHDDPGSESTPLRSKLARAEGRTRAWRRPGF